MKSFFKFVVIFFTLVLSTLISPSSLQNETIEPTNYIQNIKSETVVLVSNNMLNSEITSYQEENSPNFSGSSPLVLNLFADKNLYSKNKTQLNGCFIHNLSTNSKKIQPIRAP